MQRVFAVGFSGDGSYVFSGSDDMNVRVWKAEASEALGVALPRERAKAAYDKALLARYKHLPEVKRITRHRRVPAAVHKARTWMTAVAAAAVVVFVSVVVCCCLYPPPGSPAD
jgi:DDB1- and CUL4-associated factor 13